MPFDPYYDDYSHPSRHISGCRCTGCRQMWGEAWHRVTPKRKSGDRVVRDPSQRRIAKYNYHCQHPHEYLEIWQVESTIHPRHLRWARREREALRTAGHRCRRRQGCPKGVKSLLAWMGTEEK